MQSSQSGWQVSIINLHCTASHAFPNEWSAIKGIASGARRSPACDRFAVPGRQPAAALTTLSPANTTPSSLTTTPSSLATTLPSLTTTPSSLATTLPSLTTTPPSSLQLCHPERREAKPNAVEGPCVSRGRCSFRKSVTRGHRQIGFVQCAEMP
jgi:hypothetical protein